MFYFYSHCMLFLLLIIRFKVSVVLLQLEFWIESDLFTAIAVLLYTRLKKSLEIKSIAHYSIYSQFSIAAIRILNRIRCIYSNCSITVHKSLEMKSKSDQKPY